MLGLPTHWLYLVKQDGSKENVMNTDCSTKKEVRDEVNYLFKKCGYNKSDYIKAQYVSKDQETILYEFNIDELED